VEFRTVDVAELADDRRAVIDARVSRALGRYADKATVEVWPALGEIMGWGRSTCYEAVRSGVVPSIRVGKAIRVPTPALAALLLGVET
jgi:hypothetical protein